MDGASNLYIADPGIPAVIFVNRAQANLTFPDTAPGSTSAVQTVTAVNSGNLPLTMSGISVAANFPQASANANGCGYPTAATPLTINAGMNCELALTFAPAVSGIFSGTAVFTDNTLNASAPTTQTATLNDTGGSVFSNIVITGPSNPVNGTTAVYTVSANSGGSTPAVDTVGGTYAVSFDPPSAISTKVTMSAGTGSFILPSLPVGPTLISITIGTITGTYEVMVTDVPLETQAITFTPTPALIYGAAPVTMFAQSTSYLPVTFKIVSGQGTLSGRVLTLTGAGSIVVEADQGGDSTYDRAPAVQQTIMVAAVPLTVNVDDVAVTFGQSLPASSYRATGFVNSDSAATVLRGAPVFSISPTGPMNVGTYILSATQGTLVANNGGYTFVFGPGNLVVNQASQTVNFATIASRSYGDGSFIVAPSSSSALPVTVKLISGPATISGSRISPSGVGAIVLEADVAGNLNYTAGAGVQQTVVVTPAALVVSIDAASRAYGIANPVFTGTLTGLVNADLLIASYSSAATTTSAGGTYPITATISGANLASYNVSIHPGTLTVTGTPLTIVVNSASKVYGAALPPFTGTIGGLLNGDTMTVTYSTVATATSPAGTYPITATASGPALGSYTPIYTDGKLMISQAASSVAVVSSSAQIDQGAILTLTASVATTAGVATGTVSLSYSTAIGGMAAILGSAPVNAQGVAAFSTPVLVAGAYLIDATYSGDTNFTGSSSALLLQAVIAPSFTVAAGTTTLSVSSGQAGTTKVTLTPNGGFNGTPTAVCSGLPASATCSLSTPLTATGNDQPVSATLTISTSPKAELLPQDGIKMKGEIVVASAFAGIFWLVGLRRRTVWAGKIRLLSMALLLLLSSASMMLSGCGGSSSTTASSPVATTYPVSR